jgi:hypothetical protein
MTRHNLCPNPSAKTAATGYSGTAAPSRVTGLSGFPRTTGMAATTTGYIQSPTAACSAGAQIVVSLHASAGSTLGPKTVYCAFTRSAGGDDFSQTFTITVDATVHRATFSATAPANTTGVYLLFDGIPSGTNMVGVMYEPGTVDGGYADGDTSGWVWDGTNGSSASSESGSTDIPTAGTLTGAGVLSSSITSTRLKPGTLTGHGTLSGVASGGDTSLTDGAAYDIEEIMDALAATFNGQPTGDTIGGQTITLMCSAEVIGEVEPPAIVLEIDNQEFDLSMAGGADSFQVTALALVTYQDTDQAQRLLWRFLSRKPTSGLMRLKATLLANQSLGGLVSYAHLANVRSIGQVVYNGVDYLGAELIIEVMS